MLFARQGRPPAVCENQNRWDNYLHPDRALPVRARAVPPGFFSPAQPTDSGKLPNKANGEVKQSISIT